MTTEKKTKPEQGLSLLDIGAPFENVPVGDKKLAVYGLSMENLIDLIQRFPEAGQWLGPDSVDMKAMLAAAPKLLQAVIASATGTPGDEDAENIAARLAIEVQLNIVQAVIRLTFKDGFGPFVERIAELSAIAASVNFGRVMATNSRPPSSSSSQPDTIPQPSGD